MSLNQRKICKTLEFVIEKVKTQPIGKKMAKNKGAIRAKQKNALKKRAHEKKGKWNALNFDPKKGRP